jgi:hypothetical protein
MPDAKQSQAKGTRAKRYFVLLSGDSMCRHIWKGWPEVYETLDQAMSRARQRIFEPEEWPEDPDDWDGQDEWARIYAGSGQGGTIVANELQAWLALDDRYQSVDAEGHDECWMHAPDKGISLHIVNDNIGWPEQTTTK